MRVFLVAIAVSLFPVANSFADSGYRLLHFDKSFRDQKCIGANPPTALCAVETEETCRFYREPSLCESIDHPHYGWFSRRKLTRYFIKVGENRMVSKSDISFLRKRGFKRKIRESDTLIRVDHGVCLHDHECVKRNKEYNQDLPEDTGCANWFNCSLSYSSSNLYVLRRVAGEWRIIVRADYRREFTGTYLPKRVYPLQQRP